MGSGCQRVGVIDPQQVQVQVEEQRSGVLCVNFKLGHGLHVATVYIVELVVNQPLEQLVVDVGLLLRILQQNGDGLLRPLATAQGHVDEGLLPPPETSLADAGLLADLARLERLQKEGMDAIVVLVGALRHVLPSHEGVEIKFLHLRRAMLLCVIDMQNAGFIILGV
jgi:hypothetical protein